MMFSSDRFLNLAIKLITSGLHTTQQPGLTQAAELYVHVAEPVSELHRERVTGSRVKGFPGSKGHTSTSIRPYLSEHFLEIAMPARPLCLTKSDYLTLIKCTDFGYATRRSNVTGVVNSSSKSCVGGTKHGHATGDEEQFGTGKPVFLKYSSPVRTLNESRVLNTIDDLHLARTVRRNGLRREWESDFDAAYILRPSGEPCSS